MNAFIIVLIVIIAICAVGIIVKCYINAHPDKKAAAERAKERRKVKKQLKAKKIHDYFDNSHPWLFYRKDKR